MAQDGEFGVLPEISVDQPADHGEEKNGKGGSKGGDEEVHLGAMGLLPRHVRTDDADHVEQNQGRYTHRGVEFGVRQMLEGVDDDLEGGVAGIEELANTQHGWHLARRDREGRARHEGGDGREGDKVDNPTATNQTDKCNDSSTDDA